MKVLRLRALMALIAMAMPSSVSAITDAAIKSQCQALTTCYKGGVLANTCSIQTEKCPPCVTFGNSGCFDLKDGKCNFGNDYDCTKYWSGDGGTSAGSGGSKGSSGTAGNSGTSGSKGSTADAKNSTSTSNSTTAAPSSDGSSSSKSGGGTDISVLFGIVGAAIGVIAVAIIFFALLRRSRAPEEVDDEMAATPPALAKAASGPSTTTNAASYAPFSQRAGSSGMPPANPTTPTTRVVQYYQDNALPSPHGGRGGGGFGQQTQQQTQVKTVRPAAASNAPTFFRPNPPTGPAPQARVVAPPQQQEQYNYYGQGATAAPAASANPRAEPLFTVHTGTEGPQVVRPVSSPHPRRESYDL